MDADLPTIGAAGAGRMGRGIALAFAYGGHRVHVIDLKTRDAGRTDALEADVRAEIERDLRFLTSVGALPAGDVDSVMARIGFASGAAAPAALAACAMVFEGVPETLDAKREAFATIGAHVGADCIVASTSSTMDPDTLAALVRSPARFLNAHWLNPAHLMPLVEISPARCTDPIVVERMRATLTAIGKVPVTCKGSPGYIVPRIQALAMNEAARMVEEGVASAADIDTAIRVGFGLRFAVLGLLEFIDWGGGDILYHASRFLSDRIDPARFAAPPIIDQNMAGERRGLRDGAGFYDYAGIDVAAYRNERLAELVGLLRQRDLMPRRPA